MCSIVVNPFFIRAILPRIDRYGKINLLDLLIATHGTIPKKNHKFCWVRRIKGWLINSTLIHFKWLWQPEQFLNGVCSVLSNSSELKGAFKGCFVLTVTSNLMFMSLVRTISFLHKVHANATYLKDPVSTGNFLLIMILDWLSPQFILLEIPAAVLCRYLWRILICCHK